MKVLKSIVAGLMGLALVNANATTIVHITGSTAYRTQVTKSILTLMGATTTSGSNGTVGSYTLYTIPNGKYGYTGGDPSTSGGFPAASYAIYTGTMALSGTSTPVIIKTGWSGSLGGLLTVTGQIASPFLSSTDAQSSAGTSGLTAPNTANGGTVAGQDSAAPEVCMSDIFQASSFYQTPALTEEVYAGNVSGCGIVPFQFVGSNGTPARLTNMTPQYAQYLYGNGQAPLALLTGSNADENTIISAIGRDNDSGTRATAFAETGVGIGASVTQYQAVLTSGTVTGENPYPQETLYNTIVLGTGDGGYASGGNVATVMGAPLSPSAVDPNSVQIGGFIAYLSTGDAATAVGLGAHALNYNGVPFSNNAIIEGQYTFWGYEHVYVNPSAANDQKAFASALSNKIGASFATISLSSMNVNRASDGANVQANYF